MSKEEKSYSCIGGAVISGGGALAGLSMIFGSAALSSSAMAGAAIGVAACSAVFFYAVGAAIQAGKPVSADRTEARSQNKDDGPPPSPRW